MLVQPPKQHEKAFATIGDFKIILKSEVSNEHEDSQRALGLLDAPIDSLTNAPRWIINYLHDHKDRDIPEKHMYKDASLQGYDYRTVRRSLDEYVANEPNIGRRWDSNDRVAYLRWYDMEQEEYDRMKGLLLDF